MKDILDIVVWVGFIYLLFIFLRGLNETQIQKHDQRLRDKKHDNKTEGKTIDDQTIIN